MGPDYSTPPGMPPMATQQDVDQLNLLTILWKVYSGLACLGACFGCFYIGMGTMFASTLGTSTMTSPSSSSSMTPVEAQFFGGIFMVVGIVIIAIAAAICVLDWLVATRIKDRTGYMFVFVMSCIVCINAPFGTALGVFSLIVLSRPSVKALFGAV